MGVGAGVAAVAELFTVTVIEAVPIGVVPPLAKAATVIVWEPLPTLVEFHEKFVIVPV